MTNTITKVCKDNYLFIPSNMENNNESSQTPRVFTTEDGRNVSYRIRRLVPREAFYLMGVSEHDTEKLLQTRTYEKKVKGEVKEVTEQIISDSSAYKLAGNSIVTNCLSAIYNQIWFADDTPVILPGQQMELDLFGEC